jgi:sortase A
MEAPRVETVPARTLGGRHLAGVVLSTAGILLSLVLVYLYAFTPLTAARDQHRLVGELTGNPQSTFALTRGVPPRDGRPVALLHIGALRLNQAVVEGTSATDLENGPGLMPGTVLPGEAGNAVIAGRRATFGGPFSAIGSLDRGDPIRVTDGLGSFTFRVRTVRDVAAGRLDIVGHRSDNRLTLVTSDSSLAPGGLSVVVAGLVGRPVSAPAAAGAVLKAPPAYERGLGGDPGALWQVLAWVVLLLLGVAVTGLILWRWRRPLPTYLLALPVLVACGLFAAEAVARMLPATL